MGAKRNHPVHRQRRRQGRASGQGPERGWPGATIQEWRLAVGRYAVDPVTTTATCTECGEQQLEPKRFLRQLADRGQPFRCRACRLEAA